MSPWIYRLVKQDHNCRNEKGSLPNPQEAAADGAAAGAVYACDKKDCTKTWVLSWDERESSWFWGNWPPPGGMET